MGIEQVAAQQVIPPVRSEYIDSAGTVLLSTVEARFRRETTHIDSVGGVVRDYSMSGKLRSSLSYELIRKQIYNGILV